MFKWIENIQKAIRGSRNNRKSNKKKSQDFDDVKLDSIKKTTALNVITRPKGPRNRRLPKRQQIKNDVSNNELNNHETFEKSPENEPIQDDKQQSQINHHGTQFKPNLNELNNCQLKTNETKKSTDELATDNSKRTNQNTINETGSSDLKTGNKFMINKSNVKLMKQNLSKTKLRVNSMSILDDDLLDTVTNVDQTTAYKSETDKSSPEEDKNQQKSNSIIKLTNYDGQENKQEQIEKNTTELDDSLEQKREQLIQQLKRLEKTKNKCKSMVSLSQTSTEFQSELDTPSSRKNFLLFKSNNKLGLNRSSIRLNSAKSNSKLDGCCTSSKIDISSDKLNVLKGKVVSLNSLNNLSLNLVNCNAKVNNTKITSSYLKSTTLPSHQIESNQLKFSNLSNKNNTLNSYKSNVSNSHYITAISNSVSRNNSSSSNSSFGSSSDAQSNESNLNPAKLASAAEASWLKKKLKNKNASNSKFYLPLDDEQSSTDFNSNNYSNKLSNQSNRKVTLPSNNDVDELTKKFIEKGLSASIGSLKILSTNGEQLSNLNQRNLSNKKEENNQTTESKNENRRSLNFEIEPTYV